MSSEVVSITDTRSELKSILTRAKKCSNKGRMYVYESFKKELQTLNLDPVEYMNACRDLANYLEV